jgi:serine/threonine-protein kinase BUR1
MDALEHPYFKNHPFPAKPGDIPTFEESHELDRRKFRGQKAAPPPAPKGGTVGMGPNAGWGGEQTGSGNPGFGNGDSYGYRPSQNGSRYPHGDHRNPPPPPLGAPPPGSRRPAWQRDERRDDRPDTRPPPRREVDYDGGRSDRESYRSRSRDPNDRPRPIINHGHDALNYDGGRSDRGPPLPRARVGAPNIDTYIPSYGPDSTRPPREDIPRSRDDRPRRREDRDDRRHDRDRGHRDRDALDYDEHSRSGRTRSRSRSPVRERAVRERDPLDTRDRDRDVYRR